MEQTSNELPSQGLEKAPNPPEEEVGKVGTPTLV